MAEEKKILRGKELKEAIKRARQGAKDIFLPDHEGKGAEKTPPDRPQQNREERESE